MEVSTMSPLFTSPTNGPGQCEINVSSMAIHFVTLLVGVCGLAGNGAFLRLLQINAITEFVAFNHASINFLFLIFMVPSALLFLPEEVSCSAIMPPMYLSLLSQLSQFTYTMGLYQLMFISIERCRSILCLFFCTGQLSEHLLWVVMSALFWALFFVVTAVNPTVTSLCQSHEQEQCQAGSQQQQQQHKRLDIVIVLVALFSLPLSLWSFLQQLGYTAVPSHVVFLLTCITSSIKPFIYFLVGSWKRDCSMGSCWRHCSVESCRRYSSMQSLGEALQSVFEQPEENSASGNDPVEIMDTEA